MKIYTFTPYVIYIVSNPGRLFLASSNLNASVPGKTDKDSSEQDRQRQQGARGRAVISWFLLNQQC